jgi:aryl-alcohol dehydrogenase-like predicted oxidoreductase
MFLHFSLWCLQNRTMIFENHYTILHLKRPTIQSRRTNSSRLLANMLDLCSREAPRRLPIAFGWLLTQKPWAASIPGWQKLKHGDDIARALRCPYACLAIPKPDGGVP